MYQFGRALLEAADSLTAAAFAHQVTLTAEGASGAVFEDNFFDMPPGQKRTIAVIDAAGARQITVRALNGDPIRLKRQ